MAETPDQLSFSDSYDTSTEQSDNTSVDLPPAMQPEHKTSRYAEYGEWAKYGQYGKYGKFGVFGEYGKYGDYGVYGEFGEIYMTEDRQNSNQNQIGLRDEEMQVGEQSTEQKQPSKRRKNQKTKRSKKSKRTARAQNDESQDEDMEVGEQSQQIDKQPTKRHKSKRGNQSKRRPNAQTDTVHSYLADKPLPRNRIVINGVSMDEYMTHMHNTPNEHVVIHSGPAHQNMSIKQKSHRHKKTGRGQRATKRKPRTRTIVTKTYTIRKPQPY